MPEPLTPRRSKRARTSRQLNYAEDDDQEMSPSGAPTGAGSVNVEWTQEESLFLPEDEDDPLQAADGLVAVKEEPMDDDELARAARTSDEPQTMPPAYGGAEANGSGLDGLEDASSREAEGMDAGPTEQEAEDEKKDFKPVLRMSYTGKTSFSAGVA